MTSENAMKRIRSMLDDINNNVDELSKLQQMKLMSKQPLYKMHYMTKELVDEVEGE